MSQIPSDNESQDQKPMAPPQGLSPETGLPTWAPPPSPSNENTRNIVLGAVVIAVVIMIAVGGVAIYGMVQAFNTVNDAKKLGEEIATAQYEAPDDYSDDDVLAAQSPTTTFRRTTTAAPTTTTTPIDQFEAMTAATFRAIDDRHSQWGLGAHKIVALRDASYREFFGESVPTPGESDTSVEFANKVSRIVAADMHSIAKISATTPDRAKKFLVMLAPGLTYYRSIAPIVEQGRPIDLRGVISDPEPISTIDDDLAIRYNLTYGSPAKTERFFVVQEKSYRSDATDVYGIYKVSPAG